MSSHRGNEELVHGPLGRGEKVRGLPRVETATVGGRGQLLMEWGTETEETLNGLVEREPGGRCLTAVVGSARRGLTQKVGGDLSQSADQVAPDHGETR